MPRLLQLAEHIPQRPELNLLSLRFLAAAAAEVVMRLPQAQGLQQVPEELQVLMQYVSTHRQGR